MITEALLRTAKNLIYGPTDSKNSLELMQSSALREKAKQGARFDVNDIIALSEDSNYRLLLPYFALKYLRYHPTQQKEILKTLVESIRGASQEVDPDAVVAYLKSLDSSIGTPVKPNKVSRVQLLAPSLFRHRAEEVLREIHSERQTPALIAYGGLFAFEDAVQQLQPNDQLYILFPKMKGHEGRLGWVVTTREDQIGIEPLVPSTFSPEQVVALIDDVRQTGDTFNQARNLINVPSVEKPLLVNPA